MLPKRVIGKGTRVGRTAIRQTAHSHADQRIEIRDGKLLHLLIKLLDELRPVLQANLENLSVIDLADADQVEMAMGQVIGVGQFLD